MFVPLSRDSTRKSTWRNGLSFKLAPIWDRNHKTMTSTSRTYSSWCDPFKNAERKLTYLPGRVRAWSSLNRCKTIQPQGILGRESTRFATKDKFSFASQPTQKHDQFKKKHVVTPAAGGCGCPCCASSARPSLRPPQP